MHSLRSCAIWALLSAPAALFAADAATMGGTVTVGGGGALLDGNRAAFQQLTQQNKDGYGGLEDFFLTREQDDTVFKLNLRAIPGNEDYLVSLRFEKTDKFYVDAGYSSFRTFYDDSAGYFVPSQTSFLVPGGDASHVDRSKVWLEAGAFTANHTYFKARYEHTTRDGTKNSTIWGDTGLVSRPGGPNYGTKGLYPALNVIDETRDIVTIDAGNKEAENQQWAVGGRYEKNQVNNDRYTVRSPGQAAQRTVAQKDDSSNDMFAAHGFYERKVTEQLSLSGGALINRLDTNIGGSRIYGSNSDPVFDPLALSRQYRDEGFYNLNGDAWVRQTVLNLNAVYRPSEHLSVRPSLRYENQKQETAADFEETAVGAPPTLATAVEELGASSRKTWDEVTGALDVRYTGQPNWTYAFNAEWREGTGDLDEQERDELHVVTFDRISDYKRSGQKYSASANWYVRPGLTLAAQYYYKLRLNDYGTTKDPATAVGDRYPAYIIDQDTATHDANVRLSWRPKSMLTFVTRYDYQITHISSVMSGLAKIVSGDLTSRIVSQSVSWSPLPQLYLNASVNVTTDKVETPAVSYVLNGDNNYYNGSLGAGYAVDKVSDLYLDYSIYHASNFIDNSLKSLGYGADQKYNAAYLTYVRRQTAKITYTVKYGYVTNRDGTTGGMNDFDAHVIYGKVQYAF